jgi:hypothetical protein
MGIFREGLFTSLVCGSDLIDFLCSNHGESTDCESTDDDCDCESNAERILEFFGDIPVGRWTLDVGRWTYVDLRYLP